MILPIDFQSRVPVFEQIENGIEELISAGILKPGDKLPSIRELTADIGVNPNTIQKAYGELDAKGIIVSAAGRGCFVSKDVSEILRSRAETKLPEFRKLAEELIAAGISAEILTKTVNEAAKK